MTYTAKVRKDTFNNNWTSDLYEDGKLFIKSWISQKTKRDTIKEIKAVSTDVTIIK